MIKLIRSSELKFALFLIFILAIPLTFAITWSESAGTEFEFVSNNPMCKEVSSVLGWEERLINNRISFISWDDDNYNCYRLNGIDIQGNELTDCCPDEASICSHETWKCTAGPTSCSDYLTSDSCNNYNPNVPAEDLGVVSGLSCGSSRPYSTLCTENLNCKCVWNGTNCFAASEHKVCKGSACYNISNLPSTLRCGDSVAPRVGDCIFDIRELNDCNTTGRILVSWSVINWTGTPETRPDYCQDGSGDIECLSEVLLTFFTITSLIIAIIILIIFYLIVARKKRKFRKSVVGLRKKKR